MTADTQIKEAVTTAEQVWYKSAIIYRRQVKSFLANNGHGIGDFLGLISKLDCVTDLEVNTLWWLPFYPSPRKDDGYDISAYREHPDYGTLADFPHFVREAPSRGRRALQVRHSWPRR